MWKPTVNYCGYIPPKSSDEIYHSAKGSAWKEHKYIRKEGNRYIYKENETVDDAPTRKNQLMDRSPSGNGKTLKDMEEDAERRVNKASRDDTAAYKNYLERAVSSDKSKFDVHDPGLEAGAERRKNKTYKEFEDALNNRSEVHKKKWEQEKREEGVDFRRAWNKGLSLTEKGYRRRERKKGKGGHF